MLERQGLNGEKARVTRCDGCDCSVITSLNPVGLGYASQIHEQHRGPDVYREAGAARTLKAGAARTLRVGAARTYYVHKTAARTKAETAEGCYYRNKICMGQTKKETKTMLRSIANDVIW